MTPFTPSDHRVLVVDDDPTTLLTVASILHDEGFQVTEIDDALEAAERIAREPFDVLVTDFKMPGLDGLSLARKAKLLRPDTIRIMLTGLGDYEIAVAAINQGEVYRFMTKPVDEVELRINVRLGCEHLSLLREVARLRGEMKERDALLRRLERRNPGITAVKRRSDGAIPVDDVET